MGHYSLPVRKFDVEECPDAPDPVEQVGDEVIALHEQDVRRPARFLPAVCMIEDDGDRPSADVMLAAGKSIPAVWSHSHPSFSRVLRGLLSDVMCAPYKLGSRHRQKWHPAFLPSVIAALQRLTLRAGIPDPGARPAREALRGHCGSAIVP
jgi:hypothetical protein